MPVSVRPVESVTLYKNFNGAKGSHKFSQHFELKSSRHPFFFPFSSFRFSPCTLILTWGCLTHHLPTFRLWPDHTANFWLFFEQQCVKSTTDHLYSAKPANIKCYIHVFWSNECVIKMHHVHIIEKGSATAFGALEQLSLVAIFRNSQKRSKSLQ